MNNHIHIPTYLGAWLNIRWETSI